MTYTQRRNTLKTIKLNVDSAEEFRELLPTTGLFDLTDCEVMIVASWDTPVSDVYLITTLLEGAINVVSLVVLTEARTDIKIEIKDVPLKRAKNLI